MYVNMTFVASFTDSSKAGFFSLILALPRLLTDVLISIADHQQEFRFSWEVLRFWFGNRGPGFV